MLLDICAKKMESFFYFDQAEKGQINVTLALPDQSMVHQ